MAKTLTVSTIIASTSNAAGGTPTRGVLDVRSQDGGIVTVKLTNGGTGPTTQAVARILIAHNSGSTPSPASAGADWKTVYPVGGGTAASVVTEAHWRFGREIAHIEVEVTGNTGQAVTCEAFATTHSG
jgi:hypothetical protein